MAVDLESRTSMSHSRELMVSVSTVFLIVFCTRSLLIFQNLSVT